MAVLYVAPAVITATVPLLLVVRCVVSASRSGKARDYVSAGFA